MMAAATTVEDAANRKRSASEPVHEGKSKKQKINPIKQIRKQIHSEDKLSALKEFTTLLSTKRDHVLQYLKEGGNCLELLQTLEGESTIPPSIVFNLITQILLGISAKHGEYYNAAYEACRYLLNTYLQVVHKMLGLSSSKEERKVCLKLLTAIATFSSNLGRDILLNVKFHSANIELLTKHTGEKNSVRDSFVQFLTAFLVDADWHNLSVLLEKNSLLTSIISGLQYDDADTVCLIITVLKNHILENASVKKTTKMHVFNTGVVKDIVNLYNWKGLDGLKALDKNNKSFIEVDKLAKSKVSECVHDFLLILCTSYKYGLIFSDHLVGLGKKNLNGLMYTVLDSLDRPWEHSYARDLVLNICKSCPDLTKNMWLILKPFTEPRLSEKWLNAMNFAEKLIDEMEPSCIEYCAKELSSQQFAQIVEILVSPFPILKTLLVEIEHEEKDTIKLHINKLLCHMLRKVEIFLNSSKNWLNEENALKVKQFIGNYVTKHYPNAAKLLADCVDIESVNIKSQANLEVTLDILNYYVNIAPQLLSNLTTSSFDFKDFLLKLSENDTNQLKLVSIFVDVDPTYFSPSTDIFSYIFPILLKNFHETTNEQSQLTLYKLLKNSGIFDTNLDEINIWLNGIFNLNTFTFADDLMVVLRDVFGNLLEYQKEISSEIVENTEDLHTILLKIAESVHETTTVRLQPPTLSQAILGLFRHENKSKSWKKYVEFVVFNLFHIMSPGSDQMRMFVKIVEDNIEIVPSNVYNYVASWAARTPKHIEKIKGSLIQFSEVGNEFLNGSFNMQIMDTKIYPSFSIDVLRLSTFYFANLVSLKTVLEQHVANWKKVIEKINPNEESLKIVLGNPYLIKNFSIISKDSLVTIAIFDTFKQLQANNVNVEWYKQFYVERIVGNLIKVLSSQKYTLPTNFLDYLKTFPLNYSQCIKIIQQICEGINESHLDLLTYCLGRIVELWQIDKTLNPIDDEFIQVISTSLTSFNESNKNTGSFPSVLLKYLEIFPQSDNLNENLFSSLLKLTEYHKDSVDLAIFLLEQNPELLKEIENNLEVVCDKKGLIFPLIKILLKSSSCKFLDNVYKLLEPSLLKAIAKPQKVGQHFKNHDISDLVLNFMTIEKCNSFADKVQKFEVAEIFHAKLLEAIYSKVIENNKEKQLSNIITTFIHLTMSALKKKQIPEEIDEFFHTFNNLLDRIKCNVSINVNENIKSFFKLLLKFGMAGQYTLLSVLRKLLKIVELDQNDGSLHFEMMLSHSEFLNVVLGDSGLTKLEVLKLFLSICERWPDFMEKNHIALLLAAYRGKVSRCDRVVLALLQLYETKPEQTRFYDFKPFLWGRAAAIHYSVRNQIMNSVNRQPKIYEVIGILKEDLVKSTIISYPLNDTLDGISEPDKDLPSYDLKFFLPLFSHILAPEQQVRPYVFIRSGGLSLTILGLACQNKEVRQAACHVLSRLYFHLDARQNEKSSLLWIRFIEALCKGVAALPDFKLNSFAAIFFARSALILTNPKHVMFPQLSLYLTAKEDLNLATIPELYTLLFSSDVNYKEHRNFILEVLRDGMKTEKDFQDFMKSMGYKLISELYSSCLSDTECKLLILDVFTAICDIEFAVKLLKDNYSLLPQLHYMITHWGDRKGLKQLLGICLKVSEVLLDDVHCSRIMSDAYKQVILAKNLELPLSCDDYYKVLSKIV